MKRIEIQKTYKIYIGGQFPRTESGRFYPLKNKKGEVLANMCLSSRKDVRNAVTSARGAFGGWAGKTAYNRSQILYRIAEMLEGRKSQFIDELVLQGSTKVQAEQEVKLSIDRIIYYAGWCDKYQQIFSSVNPVASAHFNFSVPEPMGVIGIIADEKTSLIGLVSAIIPCIAGGNTCVVLASNTKPLCAITFAEVINSSDVPGGVVNILTGTRKELLEHFATHMDINAVCYYGSDKSDIKFLQENAPLNVKRIFTYNENWMSEKSADVYFINDLQETKTTWHPIEVMGGSGGGY